MVQQIDTLRVIDYQLGRFLCFLASKGLTDSFLGDIEDALLIVWSLIFGFTVR